MEIQSALDTIVSVLLVKILPLLLNLLIVLILLLIGLLIAKGLKWVVEYIAKLIKLDEGAKKVKFVSLLAKAEIKKASSELLGDLVYWVTILVVLIGVASFVGLGSAEMLLDGILAYIPAVFSAALVLGLGMFAAAALSGLVLIIAANIGIASAKSLAKVMNYAVIVFAFIIALGQLGIDLKWVVSSISVIVGAIGLAFAIAFGLGCKDIAADFVDNLLKGK